MGRASDFLWRAECLLLSEWPRLNRRVRFRWKTIFMRILSSFEPIAQLCNPREKFSNPKLRAAPGSPGAKRAPGEVGGNPLPKS